jgi:hypothetical protein
MQRFISTNQDILHVKPYPFPKINYYSPFEYSFLYWYGYDTSIDDISNLLALNNASIDISTIKVMEEMYYIGDDRYRDYLNLFIRLYDQFGYTWEIIEHRRYKVIYSIYLILGKDKLLILLRRYRKYWYNDNQAKKHINRDIRYIKSI